jgi:hypothetical protein
MMTNGRQKVTNLALDVLGLASVCKGAVGGFLAGVDEAEKADLENDPLLKEADDALQRAIELEDATDKQASLLQASEKLRGAMRMDFADLTLASLRTMIVPLLDRCEWLIDETRTVISALSPNVGRKSKKNPSNSNPPQLHFS